MALFRRGETKIDYAELARAVAGELAPKFEPLPRDEPTPAFGPGSPLIPSVLDPLGPQGRVPPRISQFPVAINLRLQGNRLIPFQVLRDAADNVDIMRRCIEVRKSHLSSLEWDVIVKPSTIETIMSDDKLTLGQAFSAARSKFGSEINRAVELMEQPDEPNGFDFTDWLIALLEDHFVIDAATVYPKMSLGGKVLAFELIDGATIKPLLDYRGAVPAPPNPAFQQVLHGFPRGEYVASGDADTEYFRDRLVYRPRYRRTWTPYGFSNVEQALSIADLYLKRTQWMRAEFTEGVAPELLIKSDTVMTPEQLRDYEQVFNEELAGNTVQRKRMRLLAKGMDPVKGDDWATKYNSEFDEFLVKVTCACFDMMPTELGFAPKSGIGGKGHQEGEENTQFRKGTRPTVVWVRNVVNHLLWNYTGMPRELSFQFLGYEDQDWKELEEIEELRVRGARRTVNESRAARGEPPLTFPEADMVFVTTGTGIQFLEGASEAPEPEPATPPTGVPPDPFPVAPAPAVAAELEKFTTFATRRVAGGQTWRDFEFKVLTVGGDELNAAGRAGDLAKVQGLVATLGKAQAPTGAR